jgi:hypothetical protein
MGDSKKRPGPHVSHEALTGCALTTFVYAATALANTPPPVADESISQSDVSWHATPKPSSGMRMGSLRIMFEETTLAQVISATGAAKRKKKLGRM